MCSDVLCGASGLSGGTARRPAAGGLERMPASPVAAPRGDVAPVETSACSACVALPTQACSWLRSASTSNESDKRGAPVIMP